jgi:hypothetical protein
MSNGDRMSLADGAHLAGMALLLAFSAAFILSSARAAKPAEGQGLAEIVAALLLPGASGALPWRELESRLRAHWSDAPPGARPPGLEAAPTARVAQLPSRPPADGARRRADNWQIAAWGSSQFPNAIRVRRGGRQLGSEDLEQALRSSGVPFMIECETDSVRHYRLAGKTAAYVVQYSGGQEEILFFWNNRPDALLRRDGCLITSARR